MCSHGLFTNTDIHLDRVRREQQDREMAQRVQQQLEMEQRMPQNFLEQQQQFFM